MCHKYWVLHENALATYDTVVRQFVDIYSSRQTRKLSPWEAASLISRTMGKGFLSQVFLLHYFEGSLCLSLLHEQMFVEYSFFYIFLCHSKAFYFESLVKITQSLQKEGGREGEKTNHILHKAFLEMMHWHLVNINSVIYYLPKCGIFLPIQPHNMLPNHQ